MVMKRNAMRKNLRQSIIKSFGRYIAIIAIIALGASLFMGLVMTKSDMVATGQVFMDEQNMFDLRLVNSYGWTEEYLDEIGQLEGIADIEAVKYLDLIARVGDSEEDQVYRFITIPEKLNQISLRGGRMPESPNECLADGFYADDSILGTTITIQPGNEEDSLDSITRRSLTVVGYVATPLYLDMNRGTTSVGSGSLSSYFYVPEGVLELEYIPEINVTLPGAYKIYSEEYNDALEAAADELEPALQILADRRLEEAREDAEEAYQEGMEEYRDGLEEYRDKRAEVDKDLADAHRELLEAEENIADNEQFLKDGEEQIADARVTLAESEVTLQQSEKTLADSKAAAYQQLANANAELLSNYKTVSENLQAVNDGLTQLNAGMVELDAGILQLETAMMQIDSGITQLEMLIGILDISIESTENALELLDKAEELPDFIPDIDIPFPGDSDTPGEGSAEDPAAAEENARVANAVDREALEAKLAELIATREEYNGQMDVLYAQREECNDQLEQLYTQKDELEAQAEELEANQALLEDAMDQIEMGFVELASSQLQMENQFSAAEAQLEAGAAQIETGYKQLDLREAQIADGWIKLEEGRQELADGWKEYEEGKEEAKQEFQDAWNDLVDANRQMRDARETIDGMTENEIIILNRNSNIGYNSLDSSSDIVSNVSRVFPVFFILVAALVCITTMTRMIDEERTQIGTLKALGYSSRAIISKYMLYAGSGAVIGCGLGVLVGSVIFPNILWQAYKIMLYITDGIEITFNWLLCGAIVAAYTAVMLLVTWYCCRRTLQEEPAELIRPKSPDAGKKIFMERLPFWHKISFLNKVTIRNIFRYRQRLAMMLIGIGGCTALLVTGFGLRDSIVNVVDYQFEEVTTYDLEVYFRDHQSEDAQTDFIKEMSGDVASIMFYHQSSAELDFDNVTKEIYMISAGEKLQEYISMHSDEQPVAMPGRNEVVLSAGVSDAMGIRVGDQVVLRNADMQSLTVTVSGIYDNHVYNYSIVLPETIEAQWNKVPEQQMAFVKLAEDQDPYEVSALISDRSDVMNVTVSEDLADMVSRMMEALDLVIVVVVFCAGLLAVIVLYNLTNININERIREIATIKVLGFNAAETAGYVFKENITLTVFGTAVGLLLGNLLLSFVMSQIKIDMVWFKALVMPVSYVWAVVLTILSACVVNFIFYFKLDKINMAEALKSVE